MDLWNAKVAEALNSSVFRNIRTTLRIAGTLTLLGSGYIVQDILKDATRRKATKNRIMLFMSFCDILNSMVYSLPLNAMAPKDSGIPGAIGNDITCAISGFTSRSCLIASSFFNVSLALCYLLIVKYEYSDERLCKLEPYFLIIPILLSLVQSIPGLPYGLYNPGGVGCAIGVSPIFCDNENYPLECTADPQKHFLFNRIFSLTRVLLLASIIIASMVIMFLAVLERERSGDRFRFSSQVRSMARRPRRDLSNMMKNQGFWYSAAFVLAFLPYYIYDFAKPEWRMFLYFSLFCLHALGFINAFIYVRPRFVRFRRENSNVGVVSSVWHTLARSRPSSRNLVTERRYSLRRSSSFLGFSIGTIRQRLSSFFLRLSQKENGNSVTQESNVSYADESTQAEFSRKEVDIKFPIELRNQEEIRSIKCDNIVEEAIPACEVSKTSWEMMGQKSDSFDIQGNEVESISGSKHAMGQNNDSSDIQINEVESMSGSKRDDDEMIGHKSGNLGIQGNDIESIPGRTRVSKHGDDE